MKQFFSLKFDTAKNTTVSVLKLAGVSLIGLIFLGLMLLPFTDTEIRDGQGAANEERPGNGPEKQKDVVDERQVTETSPPPASSHASESRSADPVGNEKPADPRSANSEAADTANAAAGISLYRVVKVVDGDTVDVLIDGETERIRIIGLDTPETVDPRRPVECFGLEASAKAKELLLNQRVSLEADPTQGERGAFGRLLRYVFLADGRNYALEMIRQGYGHEYTYNAPHKHQQAFQQAEKEAEAAERGLWAPGACANRETEGAESGSNDLSGGCHSAYEPCLPVVVDLNCSDVDGPVTVKDPGVDPYRLDGDGDGTGCESS